MAPYMIHTSFQHELYELDIPSVPNNYRQIASTAASTISTDAPAALEAEDDQAIIVLARDSLLSLRGNTRMRERIPQNEGTHSLRTEADVLDASRLYLLYPVHAAVKELLSHGRLECRREHTSHTSRTDIVEILPRRLKKCDGRFTMLLLGIWPMAVPIGSSFILFTGPLDLALRIE